MAEEMTTEEKLAQALEENAEMRKGITEFQDVIDSHFLLPRNGPALWFVEPDDEGGPVQIVRVDLGSGMIPFTSNPAWSRAILRGLISVAEAGMAEAESAEREGRDPWLA